MLDRFHLKHSSLLNVIRITDHALSYFNSCLNPVLYALYNHDFFIEIFFYQTNISQTRLVSIFFCNSTRDLLFDVLKNKFHSYYKRKHIESGFYLEKITFNLEHL